MGLPELWETIREFEEVKPIAQLAEEHFQQHGRPFRLAIDEPDWRFNNLSPLQVHEIRNSSTEAFRGIEKAMFYRICKFLTRNIQLIFVFDGPGVPAKRGRTGGRKIDYGKRRDLQKLLRCFGIPYQEAPGEAEAECARLQVLGLVDAVYSQDSDTLMFGCSLWIHDHRVAKEKGNNNRGKENTKKSDTHVRIVRAKGMADALNLDREGFVLFAMLVGGDYDTVGLRGCGAALAFSAVKEGSLSKSLCLCRNQRDCANWRQQLVAFLQTKPRSRHLAVPVGYPDFKILQKYYDPKVTPDELLRGNKSLDLSLPRPIQERKLFEVTSACFNIWGRLYMNWIGPILLMRSFMARDKMCPKTLVHDIRLVKQHASKSEEVTALRYVERKITFSPFGVTCITREELEEGEHDGMWDGVRGVAVDPAHRVECDYFPTYWLHQALPAEAFDAAPASKQRVTKRKQLADTSNVIERPVIPAEKRPKTKHSPTVRTAPLPQTMQLDSHKIRTSVANAPSAPTKPVGFIDENRSACARPKSPGLHAGPQSGYKCEHFIDLSSLDDGQDMMLRLPPVRRSQAAVSLRQSLCLSDDLASPEPSGDESAGLADAIRLSMQSPHFEEGISTTLEHFKSSSAPKLVTNPVDSNTSSKSTRHLPHRVTGDAIARRATEARPLHQIREARLKYFASSPVQPPTRIPPDAMSARPTMSEPAECIDLTGD